MGNGGSYQSSFLNITNDMVANVFINISLQCKSNIAQEQDVEITCRPELSDVNKPYEANDACKICYQNIKERWIGADGNGGLYGLQKQAWKTRKPEFKGRIDADFTLLAIQAMTCGKKMCKACTVKGWSQKAVVRQTTTCKAFNNVRNNISQKLNDRINQQLTNNKSALSGLASILGASNYQDMVQNISNRIRTKITDNVIQNIKNQISLQQTISYNGTGAGSSISGQSQNSTLQSVVTFFQKNQVFNTIFTNNQWSELSKLYNDENTIGELGNTVVKTIGIGEKLIDSIVGHITLGILIVLGVIVFSIIVYGIYRTVKYYEQKNNANYINKSYSSNF